MINPPTTHPSLLVRLRDASDQDAWGQFVKLYVPLVYQFARKKGLQDADAADVTQEVLRAVNTSMNRLEYDVQRGSFRGWLFTIAYRKLFDFRAQQRRQTQGSGDTSLLHLLEEQPAPAEQADWDEEYEKRLFTCAAESVRECFSETTWQAFWLAAVEGKSGKDVSNHLGISVAAVYLAKSRVMARLRQKIQEWEEE